MHDWGDAASMAAPPRTIQAVVTFLDGTTVAKATLAVARRLAEIEGATLHIAYTGEQNQQAREAVEELGLGAHELQGLVFEHLTESPGEGLLKLVGELSDALVVLATRTENDAEEDFGTVALAMLGRAPDCLVLVAPEQDAHGWRLRRVVMAHDGTPSADHAILPTANLAHRAGAEVIALHVAARSAEKPSEPGSLPAPRYIDQPQHVWPAWAGEFLERMLALGGSPRALNFKLLVTGGQPGSEIAQFARENQADLVVLPWHGKWDEQQSGAVNAVVRRSGCPVLLICTA
jgi:nucleotide-binding universal stress UspA family protein